MTVKANGMEGITRRGDSWGVRVSLDGVSTWLGSHPTPEAARAARDEAQAATHKGQAVATTAVRRLTVGELATEYLALKAPVWTYNTRRRHASEWAAMAPHFASRPVAGLTATDVEAWFYARAHHSPNTLRVKLGLLRKILNRGERTYGIPNAARTAELPRQHRDATTATPAGLFTYTPEEMAAAVDAATPRYRLGVLLALGLGLRSGELRGLTVDRVDFATGAIRIDRQLLKVTAGDDVAEELDVLGPTVALAPPKTRRSTATVWAGADLLEAITDHVEVYGLGDRGLLLRGPRSGYLPESTWTAEVVRIREATGVDLVGHDLRHTRASWAIANGATIAEVAADLRDSPETVVRTYIHPEKPEGSERTDAVMARLAGVRPRKTRADRHLKAV